MKQTTHIQITNSCLKYKTSTGTTEDNY